MKYKYLKLLIRIKNKINPPLILTPTEKKFYRLALEILHSPKAKIRYIPNSDKWHLRTPEYFFVLEHTQIRLANHHYFSEKRISPELWKKLYTIICKKIETDRLADEEEIFTNLNNLLDIAIVEIRSKSKES